MAVFVFRKLLNHRLWYSKYKEIYSVICSKIWLFGSVSSRNTWTWPI